jgi:hypothetical protein
MPHQRVSHGVKKEECPPTVCEGRGMVTFQQIIQGACHTMALPFTLKRILRQKKNYGSYSNISLCQDVILKKYSKRNQNPSRCYNSKTNLKFQHKPEYHLSKILI